jgi:hypothetical protein
MTESAERILPPEPNDGAQQVLHRYERFFARAAGLSVFLASAGIVIALVFLSGVAGGSGRLNCLGSGWTLVGGDVHPHMEANPGRTARGSSVGS